MEWKTAAIISIVINILFVILFILALNMGNTMIENENTCALNVCSDLNEVSYWYDEYTDVCTCYDLNQIETKSQYLG